MGPSWVSTIALMASLRRFLPPRAGLLAFSPREQERRSRELAHRQRHGVSSRPVTVSTMPTDGLFPGMKYLLGFSRQARGAATYGVFLEAFEQTPSDTQIARQPLLASRRHFSCSPLRYYGACLTRSAGLSRPTASPSLLICHC